MKNKSRYLDAVTNLNVYRQGDRRAPHKPLLLLVAVARLLDGKRELAFGQVASLLDPLLKSYAPPVKGRHQPELPYWHLRSDGLWEIPGSSDFLMQASGEFPQMAELRSSAGHLKEGFAEALEGDSGFLLEVVNVLLEQHFPKTLHSDILASVGMSLPVDSVADNAVVIKSGRKRDPQFRQGVLRAYEHRCAVSGFRAALGGQYFGCEAAHVKWHAYDGPDILENGFALEPTLHKLFDAGAWSMTDDRRVLVSADFTGAEETVKRLRGLHGVRIKSPLPGEPEISVDYIRWHRESSQGGVFRQPALPV